MQHSSLSCSAFSDQEKSWPATKLCHGETFMVPVEIHINLTIRGLDFTTNATPPPQIGCWSQKVSIHFRMINVQHFFNLEVRNRCLKNVETRSQRRQNTAYTTIFFLVSDAFVIDQFFGSGSRLDPDSGVLWIQGLKKRSKVSNNHNIILLFSDFYNF